MKIRLLILTAILVSCGTDKKEEPKPVSFSPKMTMIRSKTSNVIKDTTLEIREGLPAELERPVSFTVWTKTLLGENTGIDSLLMPNSLFNYETRMAMDRNTVASEMTVVPGEIKGDCRLFTLTNFTKPNIKIKEVKINWCQDISEVSLFVLVGRNQITLSYSR